MELQINEPNKTKQTTTQQPQEERKRYEGMLMPLGIQK